MRIHALTTGAVRLKHAFLHARQNWRRQLDIFLPGSWSGPVPIHCWAVEHGDQLLLVDTGETAAAHNIPFARFEVRPDQELAPALAAPFALDSGPFGAFPRSRALSDDGRVVAVDTAGHTAGHISVVCVDDDDRHILLAGDATDTLEQLRAVRVDAIAPKPAVSIATMQTILAHGRQHPTVYLPSHDLESVARLQGGLTL